MDFIYLDHAATTPLKAEVLERMTPYLTHAFANADSAHALGRKAMAAVDAARDNVAEILRVKPSEIYFTSGGTEADNWAVKGFAEARGKDKEIFVSSIEHAAVYESANYLKTQGYKVTEIPVNAEGIVDISFLRERVNENTSFIAVMMANNEIGTVQPVKEICEIANAFGVPVFTDGVQAIPTMQVFPKELGVSALSFSAHKIGGPKGVGVLYVKEGTPIGHLIHGGQQERARRGGTTNVAGVVGLASALHLNYENMQAACEKIRQTRDFFIRRVREEISCAILNGSIENRVVSNANFTFRGVGNEAVLHRLDMLGVCASAGSACTSGTLQPSKTLLAMGLCEQDAKSSIRFSFGEENTLVEAEKVVGYLKQIIGELLA
ncbi:MAG: cysteine desulfurase [Clostridiales bacterium]|nr:cysteine desulfurase [Clostridiales bacterium]